MTNLSEELINMYEMSNLVKCDTGLDRNIWVSVQSGNERHGPRIKIQRTKSERIIPNDWYSVTISDTPTLVNGDAKLELTNREFNKIKEFITTNKKTLLDYWNGKISTKVMVNSIKAV